MNNCEDLDMHHSSSCLAAVIAEGAIEAKKNHLHFVIYSASCS